MAQPVSPATANTLTSVNQDARIPEALFRVPAGRDGDYWIGIALGEARDRSASHAPGRHGGQAVRGQSCTAEGQGCGEGGGVAAQQRLRRRVGFARRERRGARLRRRWASPGGSGGVLLLNLPAAPAAPAGARQ